MQRNASHCRALRAYGFTLLELLVTLAVAALVLGIGVPAFNTLSASAQQTTEINNLVRHLQLARSHAVKTGKDHVLCPSSDQIDCRQDSHWEDGYILFEDRDGDGARDPQEQLLQVSRPTGSVAIDMQSNAGRKLVIYRADGRSAGSNLTLTFCDPGHHIPPKAVILSNNGRPRVATRRWDGSPLSCSP